MLIDRLKGMRERTGIPYRIIAGASEVGTAVDYKKNKGYCLSLQPSEGLGGLSSVTLWGLKIKQLISQPILGVLLLFATALCSAQTMRAQGRNFVAISPKDTPADIVRKAANVVPSARQFEWQRQELTAFVHFGINTFTNREWGDGKEDPKLFFPKQIDADQWVRELSEVGFKCIILTCKHHDGFCLWPSAYTEHSVRKSPWLDGQGDVVRMVSDACQKYGVSFGVYLSPWDRHSPLYGTEAYNDYFVNQLTELLTQYGKVSEVWFDGANGEGANGKKQVYDFVRWYQLIRQLQPEAVIAVMGPDCRWVGTETGRGRETEWSVVPMNHLDPTAIGGNSQQDMLHPPVGDLRDEDLGSRSVIEKAQALAWYPAETDVSIRPGWFYHSREDSLVKTPRELMDIYFTSVGRNGVLLLNVPPDTDGRLATTDVQALRGFKALREATFAHNLLTNAQVKASRGRRADRIADGDYNTSYSPPGKDGRATLTFTFAKPSAFNLLVLQEDIRRGQRVEAFILEVRTADGAWRQIATGTTVGYKRILRFDTVTASEVRLVITESRLSPHLAEAGLYLYEE